MKGSNRLVSIACLWVAVLAFLSLSTPAYAQESGQRAFGQSTVEPAGTWQ